MSPLPQMIAKRTVRIFILLGIVAVLLVAAWRISHLMLADAALAKGDTATALRWNSDHPEALLQQAEAQLAGQRLQAAATTTRRLLQVEPTDGRGYRVLAQVAMAQGQKDNALALYQVAARRAPRDLQAQAWLAQHALEQGDRAQALTHIDDVLTLSPATGAKIFPVLLTLSADAGFAEALAEVLKRKPSWRPGMLAVLRHASPKERVAADQVMGALQRKGGFDAIETSAWIDALLASGRWGEAHARWASPLVAQGKPLPLLFNGDFTQLPTGEGFDWRMRATPGVILDLEQGQGSDNVLHARFLGRRVAGAFLEHPLLLPPGHYQMRYRHRADALISENGVAWTLVCATSPSVALAQSAPLSGSRGWRLAEFKFVVPKAGCEGQWLRLGNAGRVGAGQLLTGQYWLSLARIVREP